jgi:hypothetical protein
MRLWPALVLAPLSALASLSVAYALATPACQAGRHWLLHLPFIAFLLVNLSLTALAWQALSGARREFLPLVATWTGAFFTAVIAAQWIAVFLIAPCTS